MSPWPPCLNFSSSSPSPPLKRPPAPAPPNMPLKFSSNPPKGGFVRPGPGCVWRPSMPLSISEILYSVSGRSPKSQHAQESRHRWHSTHFAVLGDDYPPATSLKRLGSAVQDAGLRLSAKLRIYDQDCRSRSNPRRSHHVIRPAVRSASSITLRTPPAGIPEGRGPLRRGASR